MKQNKNYDIKAKLYFLSTKEGGRSSKILKVFRCPLLFNNNYYDCQIIFEKPVNPGDTVNNARIKFFNPNSIIQLIDIDSNFHLWETKIIANGIVTEKIK